VSMVTLRFPQENLSVDQQGVAMGSRSPTDARDGKKGSACSGKRIYRAPKLKVYGSIAELTHGVNGTNVDVGQQNNTKLGNG
jgi:hypothetical protein